MSMDKAKVNEKLTEGETEVIKLLKDIEKLSADLWLTSQPNWSHVGSMQHVVELLKETKAFLKGCEVKDL